MIRIERKVGPGKFYLKIFERQTKLSDAFRFVFYSSLLDVRKPPGFIRQKAYTLHHDLTCSEEEIMAKIKSRYRTYIRKAERTGITFEIENNLQDCVSFFNAFARSKQLQPITVNKLQAYGDHIVITKAIKDHQTLALHINLVDTDEKITMLIYSASRRLLESKNKNLIGIANKFLHYQDMLYFKQRNFTLYDFGGYGKNSTDAKVLGIAKFKKSFGGQIVRVHNSISIPYWVSMQIFNLLSFLKVKFGSLYRL